MKMREYKIITEYENNLTRELERLSKEGWEFVCVLRNIEPYILSGDCRYECVCLLSRGKE